eukprot:TRINITY_DN55635_c0_g1_i1.p1 TRINITY_DN55635_c0_g1~~TRINITY_DN55635_c0_g1_i1.p1  ORF type:complete len:349 (+),score=80.26 TRINITY_DN55635_c0_g1_i1:122-1048(+)
MERGLVSCEWLATSLRDRSAEHRPKLVDATWFLPNSPFAAPEDSTALAEYEKRRIPGAVFFDIDRVADVSVPIPHMLPTADTLAEALAALGISRTSEVVVYDQHGIFSAPRVWYTLKAFGHPSVAVLDGGLPQWQRDGHALDERPPAAPEPVPRETWTLNTSMVWNLEQVVGNIKEPSAKILDARPAARFSGSAPEPRAGMRGGHVPGSANVPFPSLLTPERTMKDAKSLVSIFSDAGVETNAATSQRLVTSCGSGLTACIVGLALRQINFPVESNWAVYDGSWSEYGSRSDTPIVKDGPDGTDVEVP